LKINETTQYKRQLARKLAIFNFSVILLHFLKSVLFLSFFFPKILIFLSYCDTQEHLALVELALQPIIQEFWNSVPRQQLANAFGKRDKLALLESRLTMQAMDVAFTAWGIMKTMPRAQKMTQLVNYQRSITRPTTGFPLEV